ncbi:MAG: hypothetical protein AAFP84_19640, partial [Actinomycetota bacterium]
MTVIDRPTNVATPPPAPEDRSGDSFLGKILFAGGILGVILMVAGMIALGFVALFRDGGGSGSDS